ncbi:MAG: DNA-directed RNA polymerase subunit B'' [Candidatus Micrarchaeia archaeon]
MANELLESYLSSVSLVQQQIESFNRFLDFGIQRVIAKQGIIQPNVEDFSLKLGKLRLDKPSIIEADSSRRNIMPNEARLRNLTYAAPIFLEFVPVIRGIEKQASYGEVFIGELPIMLRSNICHMRNMPKGQLLKSGEDPNDPGGYFIIKGTERVLIGLEDLAPNRIMTTKEKGGAEVTSKVFSTSSGFRARCAVTRNQKGLFNVNFPTAPKNIDLILLLRALGMTVQEILKAVESMPVVKNDILYNIEISNAKELGPSEAMLEIGKNSAPGQAQEYQKKRAETQIDTYLLPHIGITLEDRQAKAKYLIEATKRASLVANKYLKQDDKDHYANKRIKLAGELMEELFAYAFKFFVKDVKYQIERTSARGRRMSIQTIISPDTLTEKILYAMGTGTWVAGQTGVSQVLDRTNMVSTYAHLRRIKSPLAKKHPHFRARDVHGTQWGKICPSESPEGQEVGLTKYLAIMSKVTTGADEKFTEEKLKEIGSIKED